MSIESYPAGDPYQISLSTLIEVAPLLGYPLENRTNLRNSQDADLARGIQATTDVALDLPEANPFFYFGCLDFLVYEDGERKKFLPIEFNGTGTGGITNLAPFAFGEILSELTQLPKHLAKYSSHDAPLVLMPYYHPSRLLYERILLSQAVKHGMTETFGEGKIVPISQFLAPNPISAETHEPTVLVGGLRDFIALLEPGAELHSEFGHGLTLRERTVAASFHDVFCQNLANKFDNKLDYSCFLPVNRFFSICSDKGLAYRFMNEYLQGHTYDHIVESIPYCYAHDRDSLIEIVMREMAKGRKLVVKPHGAGLGTGIEFFLAQEDEASVIRKIDASLHSIPGVYGVEDASFPYTICDFLDSSLITRPEHPLQGHKYELRVVVYRYGNTLKAFPAHVKIAGEAYEPDRITRHMIMNNHVSGMDPVTSSLYRVPLSNRETLHNLGVTLEQLEEICHFSTGYVRHVIREFYERPQCFDISSTSNPVI